MASNQLGGVKRSIVKDPRKDPFLQSASGINKTFLDSAPVIGSTTETKSKSSKLSLEPYNYEDIYNNLLTDISGGYSSGGGAYKPDVSALLAAYNQQNEAANETAKSNYEITKNSLIESLKRFQEQNMKQQQQQKQQLINAQSELGDVGAQESRNERINAGLRGLSGSGIQQLQQLQRLSSQGSKITDVASKNTEALTKLSDALVSKQEKTDEALADALNTYTSAVNKANETYGNKAADVSFDAEKAYASALANSYGSSESDSDYGLVANDIYNILNSTTQRLQTNLDYLGGLSKKELKDYAKSNGISLKGIKSREYKDYIAGQLRNNALDTINELNETYPVSRSNYNTASNNIYNLLRNFR